MDHRIDLIDLYTKFTNEFPFGLKQSHRDPIDWTDKVKEFWAIAAIEYQDILVRARMISGTLHDNHINHEKQIVLYNRRIRPDVLWLDKTEGNVVLALETEWETNFEKNKGHDDQQQLLISLAEISAPYKVAIFQIKAITSDPQTTLQECRNIIKKSVGEFLLILSIDDDLDHAASITFFGYYFSLDGKESALPIVYKQIPI